MKKDMVTLRMGKKDRIEFEVELTMTDIKALILFLQGTGPGHTINFVPLPRGK